MALDFPTSPTNGQEYNGYVYTTAIGAWQAKPAAQSPFYTSDTPPSNPVDGDSWFNTNDGTMYIYFNDGNTSQWVEHRSEIARSQVGLVPLRPTSVVINSGTASVDVNGLITVSSASDIRLNGIFSSAYKNYRIIFNAAISGTSAPANVWYIRFASGGTTNSTANYTYTNFYSQQTSFANLSGTGTGQVWGILGFGRDCIFEVHQPADASTGTQINFNATYGHTYMLGQTGFNGNTAFDGIQFANNFYTGTFKVYGYN